MRQSWANGQTGLIGRGDGSRPRGNAGAFDADAYFLAPTSVISVGDMVYCMQCFIS